MAHHAVSHVLVVEDSDIVSGAMRALVEHTGRRVSIAASVEEAIASVDSDPPDLILLDLTLKDGDGLQVADHVRERGDDAVVVALTGHDAADVEERCLAAGCRAVLLKPVPARELMARMDEWLGEG